MTNSTTRTGTTTTNTPTTSFSMQMINVCGLRGKLDIPEFRNTLEMYDINLISETKLDAADEDHIIEVITTMRLKAFFKHRTLVTPFKSGGLCIIYKQTIAKYIKHIITNSNLVQWMLISKVLVGTDKDLMVGNTYIPPHKTRYHNLTPYVDLQKEFDKFSNCYICFAGDLNSHTNNIRDYVEEKDFMVDQLNYDTEAQNNLSIIKYVKRCNIRLDRSNSDLSVPNAYGTQLIEFCKTNNMFICNGRLNSDINGKATTSAGSVIDYLIVNHTILSKVENFSVHDFDAVFSDQHCRVSWLVKCPNHNSNESVDQSKIITIKKNHRNMWASDKAIVFANQLNKEEINNIRDKVGNYDVHIDCIINDIQKLFKCTADKVLGPEYEFEIDINKKPKPMKFDRETLKARNKYFDARRYNNGSDSSKKELTNASRIYKKAVAKEKAIQKKKVIKKLSEARTKNPKFYWSVLNRKYNKHNNSCNKPPMGYFYEGFKELSGTKGHGEYPRELVDTDVSGYVPEINSELADDILNTEFTEDEIRIEVRNLKNGKACGTDKILNDFIKSTFSEMKHIYVEVFNRILNEGYIPESWTIGMISPIFKNKGDRMDFDNYRGITILSCLGKLFTSVINTRLNRYANEVNLINENQTGFRKNYSTLDHIFLLKNLIDIFVKHNKQKLYCAFVDYKKAFDTVWRSALWHKLVQSGITGKLYNVIVNMYKDIKSCVNSDGNLSDYFASFNGVRQGENLSPFLFALFINDFEHFLLQYGCKPIEITGPDLQIYLKLLIIMYADDTVLFANSIENLQRCLNGLKQYCDKWKLQVNVDKTKIIIFSNKKVKKENITFSIGGKNIEIVEEFKYLGVTFKYNGNFNNNIKALKTQGDRAIFSIIKKARKYNLPVYMQFELFDKMVIPVILYGCETWGFKYLATLEKLHLKFCKFVMEMKTATPDVMVYGESGRFKLEYYAKKRMINFWAAMVCGNRNKLSFIMYNLCKERYERGLPSSEWFKNLVDMLNKYGIYIIPEEELCVKAAAKHMLIYLKRDFVSDWENLVNNAPKCSVLYKHIKSNFGGEYYLSKLPYELRIAISRIRTCNHKLPIEAGRYIPRYTPRENRICTKCDSRLLGDEYHFILICTNPVLLDLRNKYISPYYTLQPSLNKLAELFNNKGIKLFKLARFVIEGLKLY